MQFSWIKNKKYLLIACSIFLVLAFALFQAPSFAKERFVKLNMVHEDREIPVVLNENEIFYGGVWNGYYREKSRVTSASIYNIKTKKTTKLNSYMNVSRTDYGAIKYNDDNILLIGGYCSRDNDKRKCDGRIVENYSISKNKFEKLDNLPLYCASCRDREVLVNNKILIITPSGIMQFNDKNKKFEIILKSEVSQILHHFALIDNNTILIWGSQYKINDIDVDYKTRERSYYTDISKYNISLNKITKLLTIKKPYRENPIAGYGIPINNKVLFLKGNQDGGNIYIYDYLKNKIENHGTAKFGTEGSSGVYLGNDKVLLVNGTIDEGAVPFDSPTYLEYAILDLKTNKFSKVKTTKKYAIYKLCNIEKDIIFIDKYSTYKSGNSLLYINK